jgi:hypothetical protein
MRPFKPTLFALTAASITCGLLVTTAQPPPLPGAPDDHFLCYRVEDVTVPPFAPILGISLTDEFGSGRFDVKKPKALCIPADKRGEGIVDDVTHLKSYQLKSSTKTGPQSSIRVVNQFGETLVDTGKTDRLLIPTSKSLTASPQEPPPSQVDHYKCYRTSIPKGQPRFRPIPQVLVTDQFDSKYFDLKKPKHLCTPVSKNGEPIKKPSGHLLCYPATLSKRDPKQSKHTSVRGIHVNNQFGPERLDTVKVEELCVPSVLSPTTTTTSTTATPSTAPPTTTPPTTRRRG